jgi:hypothetical protein
MMIEPPRQLLGCGVFEIHDRVFAFSELFVSNVLACFVRKAFVFDLCSRLNVRFIEPRKHSRRRDSVKTIVVI